MGGKAARRLARSGEERTGIYLLRLLAFLLILYAIVDKNRTGRARGA